jgi:hypothetical protein
VLALVVLVGGGAAAVLLNQKKEDPKLEAAAVVIDPPKEQPKEELVLAKVDPEKQPAVAKEEPAPAKVEEPVAQAPERAEVKGEVLVVFRDKGELWVRAGKKVKLKQGDEVKVVGPPIHGSLLREVYGSGALMEINGTVARIDEGVVVPKDAVAFAVIEKGAVAAAAAKKRSPVVSASGEAKSEVAKVEPAAAAKPEPVKDSAPAKTEEKIDESFLPAAAPKPAALVLKGKLETSGMRGVILHNETTFRWHGCEVRLPMKKYFIFEATDAIEPGDSDNIRRNNFLDDRREPDQYMQQGYALVRCKESQGYVWWGKQPL